MAETSASVPSKPELRPRWFYARGKGWSIFSDEDDAALERKWRVLGGERLEIKRSELLGPAEDGGAGEDGEAEEGKGDGPSENESEAKPPKKPRRPSLLKAPPSGVDKIWSAMDSLNASFNDKEDDGKDKGPTLVEKAQEAVTNVVPTSLLPEGVGQDGKPKEAAETKAKKRKDGKVEVNEVLDPSLPDDHPSRSSKVPVLEDKLFDADIATMTLYPAFFKGTLLKIVRATYFYSSTMDGSYAPIGYDEPLAKDLEAAYDKAQPWLRLAPNNEKAEAEEEQQDSGGVDAKKEEGSERAKEEKEDLLELPSMENTGGKVRWESASSAKLFSVNLTGRLMSIVGGSRIVRGFDEADRIAQKGKSAGFLGSLQGVLPWSGSDDEDEDEGDDDTARKERGETHGAHRQAGKEGASRVPGSNPLHEKDPPPDEDGPQGESFASRLLPTNQNSVWLRPAQIAMRLTGMSKEDAREEDERREKDKSTQEALDAEPDRRNEGDDGPGDIVEDMQDAPPELVLCVHGIGQELASDFDALNFVYDVERMRNTSRKQSARPDARRLARGRRLQFLPICWRAGLSFDQQPEENDNYFTLQDVSNDASIPFIRNVVSKVILDVPFYLSSHRKQMIKAVRSELNRIYRLFVKRNPDFEKKGGRVSLICHSLGSALGTDILSQQPTTVKPLSQCTAEEIKDAKHLLFNVKHCYFIGSPVGFFLYLDGGQLIARMGNRRTEGMDELAISGKVGRYGCLATETLYNCFHTADPVAYSLSAACDSKYAKLLKPISIEEAADAIAEAINIPSLSITKVFEQYGDHPFAAAGKLPSDDPTAEKSKKADARKHSEDARQLLAKMGWDALRKGEKRFRALNPFGCLDFVMGSDGLSEYIDMLMAHNSYWTSETFNRFLLATMFFDEEQTQLAPKWDGFVTPPDQVETPRAENGPRPKPQRKTTQPFVVEHQQQRSTETPFTKSVTDAAEERDVLRLWAVDISGWHDDRSPADIEALAKKLLPGRPEAVAKVTRYVRPVDKARSLAARLLPRLMYTDLYPVRWGDIRFDFSPEGRPHLGAPKIEYATDYNMSHDGDWVVLAFHECLPSPAQRTKAPSKRVGVDVMARRLPKHEGSVPGFVETMDATMTEAEKRWVKSASPESKPPSGDPLTKREEEQDSTKLLLSASDQEMLARQFDLWTHKEALTKNLGKGLGFDFEKVEVGMWACDGDRSNRTATEPVLKLNGVTEDRYRFIEVILPDGRASQSGKAGATNQLVVAEGPLSTPDKDEAPQIAPPIGCKVAERQGLLRVLTMVELIAAAEAKLEE